MSFLFHFYVIRGKYLTLSFHKICIIIQGALPRAAEGTEKVKSTFRLKANDR